MSALAQIVFWSPAAIPTVLTLSSAPEHLSGAEHPPLDGLEAARDGPEGTYAYYGVDAPIELLLFPDGKSGSPLVALVPIDSDMPERINALMRLWRPLHGRKPLADRRMTGQQRRRLRLMLQAVDGRTNGASYREIAIAIYGEARVSAEPWKTSPLRDSVIGLVESGSNMVAGGYLNLLRHRRRS